MNREEIPALTAKGLRFEIRCLEDNIKVKEKMGKDATFERGLVKEYRKYLPGGSKYRSHARGVPH